VTSRTLPAALALATLLALFPAQSPALAAPRCFPEAGPAITACVDGRIREFWERQGRLPVFGYPLGAPFEQQTANGQITVQLFERARLEHHPRNAPPYDVLLGRLGADALSGRGQGIAPPEQLRDGCLHVGETGQNICEPFLSAYRRYGLDLGQPGVSPAESLALFGLPLTAPQPAVLSNGQTHTVQWFERARFEDHGAQGVLFGLLGRELSESGVVQTSAAPPTDRGGFVQVSGDQLTRLGRPVQLKGFNYYPQGRPWSEMWYLWDGPQVEQELRTARVQFGINTVRILLPYEISDTGTRRGKITPEMLSRLREMVQIAGKLDIRLIVTLFDFYEEFPAAGTREYEENLEYLRTVVGNFIGDDRIIAWDIHNEPDHYRLWAREGRASEVLDWLGRVADELHRLAPNHLVTVGMGQYQNLLVVGPDGRRPVDYSDVISLHNYNAADTARQVAELRAASGKPILLGEFGWPTGPKCRVRGYTEAEQAAVYREALAQAQGRVAGVLAWTMRDFDVGPSRRWDTREEHYGLYRADGSQKPAAEFFRAYAVEGLPAQVDTNLPLSGYGPNIPGGMRGPMLIPEAGVHVKGLFRRAWVLFDGRANYGLPLSEAYQWYDERGREHIEQHFEHAVLELDLEAAGRPGFAELTEEQQVRRQVKVRSLGPQGGRQEFEALCRAVGQ
jgi:hypothetical protein